VLKTLTGLVLAGSPFDFQTALSEQSRIPIRIKARPPCVYGLTKELIEIIHNCQRLGYLHCLVEFHNRYSANRHPHIVIEIIATSGLDSDSDNGACVLLG
jgi:hypothetical protein